MQRKKITVKKGYDGYRLDVVLAESGLNLSRRKIRAAIDVGGVYLNRKRVRIASKPVKEGDIIDLEFDPENLKKVKEQKFAFTAEHILFEDEDVIALNKPPGLPTQPTRKQAIFHVIAALQEYYKQQGQRVPTLELVHRLDMETSGVLLVAKNKTAMVQLSNQFRDKTIQKIYHALTRGIPVQPKFSVQCQLSAIVPHLGLVQVRQHGGKDSLTHFRLLAKSPDLPIAAIECQPVTGRTHQIRVHLDFKGFPILGDKRYGHSPVRMPEDVAALVQEHQLLHARQITFQHPRTGETIQLQADYPAAFTQVIERAHVNLDA